MWEVKDPEIKHIVEIRASVDIMQTFSGDRIVFMAQELTPGLSWGVLDARQL